jgi:hypothetical protein
MVKASPPAALTQGKCSGTCFGGDWMGFGAGLDGNGEETNIFHHRQLAANRSTDCTIPNASEYLRMFVKPKRIPKLVGGITSPFPHGLCPAFWATYHVRGWSTNPGRVSFLAGILTRILYLLFRLLDIFLLRLSCSCRQRMPVTVPNILAHGFDPCCILELQNTVWSSAVT